MRTPNLNAIRMFDAAARHLNFRLAAEELNLTQGAVAQQVRRLEADLGLKLFRRKARGLALTEVGRGYHAPVRRALAMIDEATRQLLPAGARVTLSVTPSLAAKWLVPRLGRLAERYPDLDLQVVASEGLADFLSDGVDIAIRQGRPPFGAGLRAEALAPLDLMAVCSPGFAANAGPVAGSGDLARHPLIQDGHRHWDRLLDDAGAQGRRRILQVNQTALAVDAAANGQGIALAPRLLVAADLEQGRLAEIWRDEGGHRGAFYVVSPEAARPDPAREAVIDWLLAEAGSARGDASKC